MSLSSDPFDEWRRKYAPALKFPITIDSQDRLLLSTDTLHLLLDNKEHIIEGEVSLKLGPDLELEFVSDTKTIEPVLFFGFLGEEVKGTSDSFRDSNWFIKNLDPFIAVPNPAHLYTIKDVQIRSMWFVVVNFCDFHGSFVNYEDGSTRDGRLLLELDGWKITIDKLSGLKEVMKTMEKAGGYGITHVGVVERIDGKSFKASKGTKIIETLEYFLSFAKGAWVPIPIRVGLNNKNESVWHDWGSPSKRTPWRFVYSWFDDHHAIENLPVVFSGFYRLMNDEIWSEPLRKVIYWYILSNTLRNVEGGIIFAQTILELLAWNQLVKKTGVISQDTFLKLSAAEQFKLLLSFLGIPFAIPTGLQELIRYAKSNNLDGPSLVSNIRNSLVHPGKKPKSNVNGDILVSTVNLAFWYVELILLRLCDYEGTYANRMIGRARWAGEVEPVPWKKV